MSLFAIIIIVVTRQKEENVLGTNMQNFNNSNSVFENVLLKNGIELIKGKIEEVDGIYYVSMIAQNNTDEDIDMSGYRISLRDTSGNEIDFFNGAAIGKVMAHSEISFEVECYKDLSNLHSVFYEEFLVGG